MATFEAIKDNAGQWHRPDGCDLINQAIQTNSYEERLETNFVELNERDAEYCPGCFSQAARK
jgi:hypothetical protein